jgi:hypothetical protein
MSTMPAVTAEPACETASACVCLSEIALREPAKREGVLFKPAALKLAIQLTRGYPYFLQECGYHSWNVAKASPDNRSGRKEGERYRPLSSGRELLQSAL